MRRREPLNPVAARELAAIDAALAGGPVAAEDAELAQLATLLVAERPPAPPAFRAALDARVAERFPAPASTRTRTRAATDRAGIGAGTGTGARSPRRPRRRPLIPAVAGSLAVALVALVIVLGQGGGSGGVGGDTAVSGPASGGASSGAVADSGAAGHSPPAAAAPDAAADAPTAEAAPQAPPADRDAGGGSGAPAPATGPSAERKVEQSSTIELGAPADRVDDVAQDVLGVVGRQQGIVDQSSVATGAGGGEARFELRIPAARLQAALAQLSRLPDAHVLARTDDTLDVNQAYVSVRRRLAGAEAERSALLRSLRAAATEAQTERLRARLGSVERTIARLERGQRALDRRVDYSRVALTVRAEASSSHDDGGAAFTPGSALDDAGRVLAVTAGVVVIALAALVPLALLAACAWPLARAARRRRREQALEAP